MRHVFIRSGQVNDQIEATSEWDGAASTLSCRVSHAPTRIAPPMLRDHIDGRLGIVGTVTNLIVAGRFVLTLDGQHRINEFDFFTYPETWAISSLVPLAGVPANLFLQADFDTNGRSASEAPPEVIYDPAHARLCLSWGLALNWYALAPTLAVGVSADHHLMQIRLDAINIPVQEWRI